MPHALRCLVGSRAAALQLELEGVPWLRLPRTMIVRQALRSAAGHLRAGAALPALLPAPSSAVGLGLSAGLGAALFSSGGGGDRQASQWIQAWLPSPASLVGEPTAACEASETPALDWQAEFDSWASELSSSDNGLQPRAAYKGPGSTADGHWTADWHLMRGSLWGEGGLEKLRIWRPPGLMIDGDVLCLVRLGGANTLLLEPFLY